MPHFYAHIAHFVHITSTAGISFYRIIYNFYDFEAACRFPEHSFATGKREDIHMKKLVPIFIFIFTTGLFTGLFFSMNLAEENNSYLFSLLICSFSDPSAGFFKMFTFALISNLIPAAAATAAVLSRFLSPLPPVVLWFKSFAVGFCNGLIYINADNAVSLSLFNILPPNLFIMPAFIALSVAAFYCSSSELLKKNRPRHEMKGLFMILSAAVFLILTGCITEAVCHAAAL